MKTPKMDCALKIYKDKVYSISLDSRLVDLENAGFPGLPDFQPELHAFNEIH